eukprot:TRINITY_DN1131_c0_g1_i4.p1 TRINITY_DN1131_c0_g1~~TRINITY_DN1131_c0_g1_i4.p1  ORF type:complete len:105 (+),score=15.18 TRINITY_DN1131_c0_g1_i4:337-651(+)
MRLKGLSLWTGKGEAGSLGGSTKVIVSSLHNVITKIIFKLLVNLAKQPFKWFLNILICFRRDQEESNKFLTMEDNLLLLHTSSASIVNLVPNETYWCILAKLGD